MYGSMGGEGFMQSSGCMAGREKGWGWKGVASLGKTYFGGMTIKNCDTGPHLNKKLSDEEYQAVVTNN